MKFNKIFAVLASAGMLAATPGCKDFYDVNVNPLSPTSAGVQSLLPVTQVSLAESLGDNLGGLSQYTMALMQQLYNTRNIGNFQQTGDSFTGPWITLYRTMLVNNELIIAQGTAEQRWDYVGIAQLQKAYAYSQMVDVWGDIPYTEALQGATTATTAANLSPRFDKDEDIYNNLFLLIDQGIANLAKGGGTPTNPTLTTVDLIYSGNLVKWANFGRTLKLKLYNQIRKTKTDAEIQNLVTPLLSSSATLIGETNSYTETEDFQLSYRSTVNPDNRNPGYAADYSANPENKIGRYFYEGMVTLADPRRPYYFFNQIPVGGSATSQDYVSPLDARFVTVRPGSTGPFVSSASTAAVQTVQGLYPIGGRFDDGRGGKTIPSSGKASAPQRMLTYYSRKFTEAELQLTVFNNPTAARANFKQGLYAAFKKVNSIATADASPLIDTTSTGTGGRYITAALTRYDRKIVSGSVVPTTTDEKLEVLMYEKYVASFGYGVDVYTDFRRTHHPVIRVSREAVDASRGLLIDDGATQANGPFPRRFYYPTNDLLLNPNSPRSQRDPLTPIFWEK